jgi:hypothetical protein
MGTDVARFRAQWNARAAETTTPAARRALSVRQSAEKRISRYGTSRNARECLSDRADIGQFAIAKLGQFADIALISRNAWIMRMSESNMR